MSSPAARYRTNNQTLASDGSPYPLVHVAPYPVLCTDRQWRVTYANLAAESLTGVLLDDLPGCDLWELFPEVHGQPVEETLRMVMDRRCPGQAEFRLAAGDTWLQVRAFSFADGVALYYQDITERKVAENAKETTAREVQAFFDAAPDSVLGIDRAWTITFCNKTARALATPGEILGADLWTRFPVSKEEPYASHYRRTMDQRVESEFEAFVPAPYNIWLKVIARPFGDGILVSYNDITARIKAEALRDAATRQLEQVLEATTDAVVSFDRDFNYTFLNRQAEMLLGRRDLLGKNVWKEFPSTDADAPLRRTMEERVACELEVFNPAPLNRWFRVQTRPASEGIVVFFRDVTEERAAKQILLDQQATLAFVQQTALVATWVVDLATGSKTITEGSFPVFGVPNDEIRTIDDFRRTVHPEDLPLVRERIQWGIATKTVIVVDFRVVDPDGGIRWLEGRGVGIYNEQGAATHLRGLTTDITERMKNEQKLRASEERYRVLAELNPQALWMGAADGTITFANQNYLDYIGRTSEQIGGLNWLGCFDAEDHQRVIAAWTHSVATGAEYAIEARLLRASDRASRWWSLRALPVRDEAGDILLWLGVSYDIHDMKMANETLQRKQEETERQRAELETIYRTAPIALSLYDPVEFRYLRVNDHLCETLHLPADQIVGRTAGSFSAVPGLQELFREIADGRVLRNHIVDGIYANGEHRYFNFNCSPVYGPDGTVQAIAAASLEITHQKKSELALIQSEKLAAVGRLATSISHEINNPLEAITNLLYLVATDGNLHESLRGYVNMAQSELSRVSQIATHTLRFHRQAVKPTMVTAEELVGSVLGLYQGRLANSNILVEAAYATKTRILCFENDIRQVLNNLIANAIDAMRGGGWLVVRAHEGTDWVAADAGAARRGVRIAVADSGHGMPAAVKARVFEPFYTTKDLNGTGLGLWISKGIVQHHEGRLTVRSSQDPGHMGTVFTLFLPLGDGIAQSRFAHDV